MEIVKKVFAYITHQDKLLIFSHPHHPEAGLQVPAGTVESGEDWQSAVLREVFEETGLSDCTLQTYLGEQFYGQHDSQQVHHRRFYHLTYTKTPPVQWERFEEFGSDGSRHLFHFFWVPIDNVPPLIAEHDAFIQLLTAQPVADANAS